MRAQDQDFGEREHSARCRRHLAGGLKHALPQALSNFWDQLCSVASPSCPATCRTLQGIMPALPDPSVCNA